MNECIWEGTTSVGSDILEDRTTRVVLASAFQDCNSTGVQIADKQSTIEIFALLIWNNLLLRCI